MRMRIVGGAYRAAFRWNGEFRSDYLAPESKPVEAIKALARLLDQLERGEDPKSQRKPFRDLSARWLNEQEKNVERKKGCVKNLDSAFGEMIVQEIRNDSIVDWANARNAPFNTLQKELNCLRGIMRMARPGWDVPKGIKFKPGVGKYPAPTFAEIDVAARYVTLQSSSHGQKYLAVYWISAFTGLDIGDVLKLTPSHFDGGFIQTKRGKTGNKVRVAVPSRLLDVLKVLPRPLDKRSPYFQGISSRAVCVAIGRAFRQSGMKFSAKSLRRFYASQLFNAGYSWDQVGCALGHGKGSKVTPIYTTPFDPMLEDMAKAIDRGAVANPLQSGFSKTS